MQGTQPVKGITLNKQVAIVFLVTVTARSYWYV